MEKVEMKKVTDNDVGNDDIPDVLGKIKVKKLYSKWCFVRHQMQKYKKNYENIRINEMNENILMIAENLRKKKGFLNYSKITV